jgi:hypothetical protein
MENYKHFISGFFPHKDQIEDVANKLENLSIPAERIHLVYAPQKPEDHTPKEDSNHVLGDILEDSAIGAAVGTGVGVAAEIALITANVSLFVASPLIAPLVLLGWGAGLGGFLGAAIGASKKPKPFLDLVRDSTKSGQHVIIVETISEQESVIAKNIIKGAIGDYQETTQH